MNGTGVASKQLRNLAHAEERFHALTTRSLFGTELVPKLRHRFRETRLERGEERVCELLDLPRRGG